MGFAAQFVQVPPLSDPVLDPTTTRSTRGIEVVWKHAIVGEVAGAEAGRSPAVAGIVRVRSNK